MSKAFTRESDDAPEQPVLPRSSPLPPGTPNYITPGGAERLRVTLSELLESERPRLLTAAEDAETRRRRQLLDQRIIQLQQSLATAVIVPAPAKPWTQVRFGATVKVRNLEGADSSYRLVGVDEVDLDRDWISWLSPLARALLNADVGQRVRFRAPSGEQDLEIVSVTYEDHR